MTSYDACKHTHTELNFKEQPVCKLCRQGAEVIIDSLRDQLKEAEKKAKTAKEEFALNTAAELCSLPDLRCDVEFLVPCVQTHLERSNQLDIMTLALDNWQHVAIDSADDLLKVRQEMKRSIDEACADQYANDSVRLALTNANALLKIELDNANEELYQLRTIIAENHAHIEMYDKLFSIANELTQNAMKMLDQECKLHQETKAKLAQYADENKMVDDVVKALVEKCDEQEQQLAQNNCFAVPVKDGFPGEIDLPFDGHSHHYVPTSLLIETRTQLEDCERAGRKSAEAYAEERVRHVEYLQERLREVQRKI